ncbi:MAG TPA: phosphopyruvate hydratase [Synergistaceae bacterium]|jgi:enolase|nr:phosphopyruvate hydratase [Synergistaceae bacterium]NLL40506.1 phosphopyruvate hydratase [Synergistaceae bacterium]HPX03197.1 phosphopyruvate hydratase [Synergistaceae bacterium]HQA53943.1 phosphopyruvate hydratase [Synergistaceae bacterium]
MSYITNVHAREVLDSRGFPTLEVEVTLDSGIVGKASIPSGASTGTYEAHELRDGDSGRYMGKGVLKAVQNIKEIISPALKGMDPLKQDHIDKALIELDGTLQKKRLGANAILGVSLATARTAAYSKELPLWRYLGGLNANLMPVPLMNVINGGTHANNNLNIQEFLIIPHGAPSFTEALRMGAETYHALSRILAKYGKSTGTGDEGGFASDFRDQEEVLDFLLMAIRSAGYQPGKEISIGLDIAANQFYSKGAYQFHGSDYKYTANELIDIYELMCDKYPIISIEDGLAEDDWQGWIDMTKRLSGRIQLIGDDIFVTHTDRLQLGIDRGAANAVLVKPNQVGTLTETLKLVEMARRGGYRTIISHRSGETADNFIADLAVATGAGQIKAGAPRGIERLRKYNRLIRIEESLEGRSHFAGVDLPICKK